MSSAAATRPRVFVQPGPTGQLRMPLPGVARVPYVTGQQEPCEPCAAVGVARQGVSRDGAGSPALCMSCWRGVQARRTRAEQAEAERLLWDELGDLETVAALEEACGACGEVEASPSCWLCGYAWLREQRVLFEADQLAAQAAADAVFEQIAALTEAEDQLADVTGWVRRLQSTVTAYGRGGGGRAVELVADLLARLDRARTCALGRPSVIAYVGLVIAVDADWRSGRRSLPGRARTAWLVGCSDRVVHDCWKRLVKSLGWATRVRIGGRNSFERRMETGRANDRAEFDVLQLNTSDIDAGTRAVFLPAALALFDEMLAHGLLVLEQAQTELDDARARTGGWVDYPEQMRRAQLRAAVERTRDMVTGPIPAAMMSATICRSHPVSKGEYLSSCSYWGLRFSRKIVIHSPGCGLRPDGRGHNNGASRSPMTSVADLGGSGAPGGWRGCCDALPEQRPRTTKAALRRSRPRNGPSWAFWAPQLARELTKWWPWLSGAPRMWIAAVLGAELSAGWSAQTLVEWIIDRLGRPILTDPAKPAAYLRSILAEVFGQAVAPPNPTRRHTERLRRRAETTRVALAERQAAVRAQLDARDTAAAAATGTGRAAARAALARITTGRHTAPSRAAQVDWPEVRLPGSGLTP